MLTYAIIGKFSNGFLSDYANIGRFMSFSLLLSAITCILMGMNTATFFFVGLWALEWLVPICGVGTVMCVYFPMVLTKTTWFGLLRLGWLT
ncbi:hypothetical protein PCI56_03205 [Plesiomonas shigelloides subsp. oncorhynchi]|nr:hypothetical protein [Plesiomonas shigelloides]